MPVQCRCITQRCIKSINWAKAKFSIIFHFKPQPIFDDSINHTLRVNMFFGTIISSLWIDTLCLFVSSLLNFMYVIRYMIYVYIIVIKTYYFIWRKVFLRHKPHVAIWIWCHFYCFPCVHFISIQSSSKKEKKSTVHKFHSFLK